MKIKLHNKVNTTVAFGLILLSCALIFWTITSILLEVNEVTRDATIKILETQKVELAAFQKLMSIRQGNAQ
ncbi:MAG TPA: hypothetical protein VJH70_02090 [Candidatus Paceibacterota bacterium]